MKSFEKKKQDILKKVDEGKISIVKAEQLLKAIEEKEKSKTIEK